MISLSIRQGLHQRHIQMIALAGAIGSELTRSVFFFSFFLLLHPTDQTWVLTHLFQRVYSSAQEKQSLKPDP